MPIQESASNMANAGRKHPVPQNVMDVEFKVVGDLTVRQVMYLFVGAFLMYVFYRMGLPFFWKWLFVIGIGALSVAVAFIPVQERGLDKWLVSFVTALRNPTQRVWKKSHNPPAYFLSDYAKIIKNEIITLTPAKSRSKLDEYLGTQQQQTTYDNETKEKLEQIQLLYAQTSTIAKKLPTKQQPTLADVHKDELESKSEMTNTTRNINRPIKNISATLDKGIQIKVKSKMPDTITLTEIQNIKKQEKDISKQIDSLLKTTKKAQKQFKTTKLSTEHKQNRLQFFNTKYTEIKNAKQSLEGQIQQKQDAIKDNSTVSNDVLKQIKSLQSENATLEMQLKELQKEINSLVSIKSAPTEKLKLNINNNQISNTKNNLSPTKKKATNKLNVHIPKLNFEIPKTQEATTVTKQSTTAQSSQPSTSTNSDNLSNMNEDKKKQADKALANILNNKYRTANILKAEKTKSQKPKTQKDTAPSEDTNIIHGVVKDASGKLLENAVVLIKNNKGDIERALKTNKLGHFKTQTKLDNGKYTIEVVKEKLKFDIIAIDINDNVLPSVTLIAKD